MAGTPSRASTARARTPAARQSAVERTAVRQSLPSGEGGVGPEFGLFTEAKLIIVIVNCQAGGQARIHARFACLPGRFDGPTLSPPSRATFSVQEERHRERSNVGARRPAE